MRFVQSLTPDPPNYVSTQASGKWVGPWAEANASDGNILATMLCTRSATLTLEGSNDQAAIAQTTNVTGTGLQACSLPVMSKFYRVSYVNGGTADTAPIQLSMQTVAVGALDVETVRTTGLTGAVTPTRYVGGTAGGAPIAGTFLAGDWIVDNTGGLYVCTVTGTPGTWVQPSASSYSGVFTAQGFATTGLTGATAAVRWVGGTTTGAPLTGTFAVGDFVITRAGDVYICTVAGTPGTWVQANSSTYAPIASPTFTGVATAPTVKVSGTTGAATPTRLVGANASGAPASGTWIAGDVATGVDGHLFVCTVGGTPGTWKDTGLVGGSLAAATSAPTLQATGLTGAVQTGRYVGVTTTGAPSTGTFAVGDWVSTRDGHMWGCTVAGSPGTWVDIGAYGGSSLTSVASTITADVPLPADTLTTIIATSSLATGTWLVSMGAQITTTALTLVGIRGVVGSATATLTGRRSASLTSGVGTNYNGFGFTFQAVVTVAGTLVLQGKSITNASTVSADGSAISTPDEETGYTAVKIA